ncbi:MAG: hypothetical protein FJ096_17590 [Deltaproteobacteria bacterium]|nr:hypothetical protein [Deltaproteobacteria bacterium]
MNAFGTPPGGGWGQPPQGGQPPYGGQPQQPSSYGAPQGFGGMPGGAPQGYGGMPGAPSPYALNQAAGLARAQNALSQTGNTLRYMQYGFVALGAVLALGGVALLITVGVGEGLGLLITGVTLAVTGWFTLPKFMGMVGQASAQVGQLAHKQQLAITGMPATGRLLQVQQTGRMVNYNPEIHVVVEVQHPQHGVYQVQTTAVVPQIAIPQAQPGAQVQVRINPANPQDIALVF